MTYTVPSVGRRIALGALALSLGACTQGSAEPLLIEDFIRTETGVATTIATKDGYNFFGLDASKPLYIREPEAIPRVIALTFDDGPHPRNTEKTLATLRKYGVHGTFFVVGQQVEAYPEIARDIVVDGNEIGNHSWSHEPSIFRSQKSLKNDFVKAQATIQDITGVVPTVYRPPYGASSPVLKASPLPLVYWSIDPQDWGHNKKPEDIADAVLSHARPGGIVILHEISQETTEALPLIIVGLQEQGYTLLTVSELLQTEKYPTYLQEHSPHFFAPRELLLQ